MSDERLFENQDKSVEYGNIIYLINIDEKTASVTGTKENHHNIFIPRSINHESKEYYVTSILMGAFKNSNIAVVQFASNSKLETICQNAFNNSTIKSIKILSSVTSIGHNAFLFCEQLKNIEIPDDSHLQTIGRNAFAYSQIKSIKINRTQRRMVQYC